MIFWFWLGFLISLYRLRLSRFIYRISFLRSFWRLGLSQNFLEAFALSLHCFILLNVLHQCDDQCRSLFAHFSCSCKFTQELKTQKHCPHLPLKEIYLEIDSPKPDSKDSNSVLRSSHWFLNEFRLYLYPAGPILSCTLLHTKLQTKAGWYSFLKIISHLGVHSLTDAKANFQGYLNLSPFLPRTLLHLKLQAKAGLYGFLELVIHRKTRPVILLTHMTRAHYLTHTMTSFLGWPQRVDHCSSSGLSLINRCVGILFHLCWCSLLSRFMKTPRLLLQTLFLRAKILPK